MDYCQYHPLKSAAYRCAKCQLKTCRDCVDEGKFGSDSRCMHCGSETQSLGAPADVVPFWRRIDTSFRYPLNKELLIFIAVISFLTAVFSFFPLPLMIGLNLLLTGVIIKYCFNCLSETAAGNMEAPEITSAYEGGVTLIFKLMGMFLIASVAIGFLYVKISPFLGSLAMFFFMIALPAVIIIFALSESMIEALNPLRLITLIHAIGLPYVLILAILMIMIASVDLLSALIGFEESVVILSLQAFVSNFYSVVMFHLMGYMIFQYQHRLGFVAEEVSAGEQEVRSDSQRLLVKIQMLLKAGDWGAVEQAYMEGLKRFPDNEVLNQQYFLWTLTTLPSQAAKYQELLAASEARGKAVPARDPVVKLGSVADAYLGYLIESGQQHQLTINHKRVLLAASSYRPQRADVCHELARAYRDAGNPKAAVGLLNGIHKKFPRYFHLVAAYELMALALKDIPSMEAQVAKCQKLIEVLKSRADVKMTSTPSPKKKAVDKTGALHTLDKRSVASPSDTQVASTQVTSTQVKGAQPKDALTPQKSHQKTVDKNEGDDSASGELGMIEFK
ncbi:hypothetical protein [Pseudomaricurvus sp.]|uniref:hypothetical protein n=1 Tax=Pseudomaricurvus sp. TaxID=2004510 RepID=UPI003F6BC515